MSQLISLSAEELESLGNAGHKASKSYMWPVISSLPCIEESWRNPND